jgi:hypothetical protein
VKADALKAGYEIEHLILGDIRILLLQADGLHGERGERSSEMWRVFGLQAGLRV